MKWATIPVGAWLALALLGGAVWPGCAPSGGEAWEVRDRHLRRARAAKDAQDVDRAIDLCEKALARKPDLALAHRELGLMLDNYRQDYLRALYHYRRYLELRPIRRIARTSKNWPGSAALRALRRWRNRRSN